MNNLHNKVLYYSGATFLAILSILAIVITVFVAQSQSPYERNTISVTGEAEVSGAPDIATFSFTASEVADTPDEAQEVISEKVSTILKGLSSLGIEEKDIKTDSYMINPKYEWVKVEQRAQTSPDGTTYYPGDNNNQVLVGYDVRQDVSITLRDLQKAGDVLELFASEGVENMYGPNFEIEDPEGLQEEARLEAIANAKEQAQRLADNLGVKLGDIVSFNENNDGGYYPMPSYMAREESLQMDMAASISPELPAGENDITSRVTVTYIIK